MQTEHKNQSTGGGLKSEAVALVAETMGELVEFWGFKSSMGKLWATLYLTESPLTADELALITGLSTGAVSMGLADLSQWDLVARVPVPGERKRYYRAHTDVIDVIRRIFRERELRLVGRAIERFQHASDLLVKAAKDNPEDAEIQFASRRVRGLLALARTGYKLIETLAEMGSLTLKPIRNTLTRFLANG
jgi:DNA-binding transcriptional regulator GbsR (MarR family)